MAAEFTKRSARTRLIFQATASSAPGESDSDTPSASRNGDGHPNESRSPHLTEGRDALGSDSCGPVALTREPASLANPSPDPDVHYEGLFSLPSRQQSMATHKPANYANVVASKSLTGHGHLPRNGLREDDRSQSYTDISALAQDKSIQLSKPRSLTGEGYVGLDGPVVSPQVHAVSAASRLSPRAFAELKKARLFSSTSGLEDRVLMNAQAPHSQSTSKSHSMVVAEVGLPSDKSVRTLTPPAHTEEQKSTRPITLVDDATNHEGNGPGDRKVRFRVTVTSRSVVNEPPPEDFGDDGTIFSSFSSQLDSEMPGNDEKREPPRRTGSDTTGSVWDGLSMFSSLADQSEPSGPKEEKIIFTSSSTLLPLFSRVRDEDLEELIARTKRMVETGGNQGGRSYFSSWRNTFQKNVATEGNTTRIPSATAPSGEHEAISKANRTRFYQAPNNKTNEPQNAATEKNQERESETIEEATRAFLELAKGVPILPKETRDTPDDSLVAADRGKSQYVESISDLTPKGEESETESRQDENMSADSSTIRQDADTKCDATEHDAERSEKDTEMNFLVEALFDIYSFRDYFSCSPKGASPGYSYCSEIPAQGGDSDHQSAITEDGNSSQVSKGQDPSKNRKKKLKDRGEYSSKNGDVLMSLRSQPSVTTRNRLVFFRKDASGRLVGEECHPKKLLGETQSRAKRDPTPISQKSHWFSAWPIRKSVRRKSRRAPGSTKVMTSPHPSVHQTVHLSFPAGDKNERSRVAMLPSALRTPESEMQVLSNPSSEDQTKSLAPSITKMTKVRKKWSRKKSSKKKRVRFSEKIAETYFYSPEDPNGGKDPAHCFLGNYFVAPAKREIEIERSWSGEENDHDHDDDDDETISIEDWEVGCFVDSVGEFVAENFDISPDTETIPFDESLHAVPLESQISFDFSDYGSQLSVK